MTTKCDTPLNVPEAMRAAALAIPAGVPDDEPPPDFVTCELDAHNHGAHTALLRDLDPGADGDAVWLTWSGAEMRVQRLAVCGSYSPSLQSACWLPERHRGGHAWERYE